MWQVLVLLIRYALGDLHKMKQFVVGKASQVSTLPASPVGLAAHKEYRHRDVSEAKRVLAEKFWPSAGHCANASSQAEKSIAAGASSAGAEQPDVAGGCLQPAALRATAESTLPAATPLPAET